MINFNTVICDITDVHLAAPDLLRWNAERYRTQVDPHELIGAGNDEKQS